MSSSSSLLGWCRSSRKRLWMEMDAMDAMDGMDVMDGMDATVATVHGFEI